MTFKHFATSALVLTLAATPATQAAADGDALVGGIVGGIIGGVIVNEANKNRQRTQQRTTTRSSSGVSSAQRAQNREVQTALNYFGFPVGTPDGAIGPRSRAAISDYQMTMGWPPTGQLNDFERDILVSSFYRAQSGGATTAALIAANPMGAKGVLIGWKNERLGIGATPAPAVPAGTLAAAPGAAPAAGVAAAVGTAAALTAGSTPSFAAATPEAAVPALPSFMGQSTQPQVSLASHCSKVSLVTNSNGGFVTQVTMTDPGFALSEQFCLARTYGMAQGEELVAKIAGYTPQQITEQCLGFGPALAGYVSSISVKPREAVLADLQGFVGETGMAPAQLAGTAKTCLGVGYTIDNMDVAVGSALLLTALGDRAYGELIGHHLATGIGAQARPDLALAWFDGAFGQPGEVVNQVFAPGMRDRAGLIRMAAYAVAGQPMPGGAVVTPAPASAAAAPDAGMPAMPKLPFFGGASATP